MDWTATIVSKDYSKGNLLVGIEYTNGDETFSESMDMTGKIIDVLDLNIQNRLNELNVTSDVVASLDVTIAQKASISFVSKPIPAPLNGLDGIQ